MKFNCLNITKFPDLPYYDLIVKTPEDYYVIFYRDEDGGHKTEEDDLSYDREASLITTVFSYEV